jgi:RNA polymerase sigma-70 factor (ECF subfamily)
MDALDARPDRAAIVREFHRGVWRYLRVLGCDPATADDLAQDVFLRVLRRPLQWRGRPAAAAYLRKAARTAFLGSLRRAERRRTVPLADAVDRAFAAHAAEDGGDGWLDAVRTCLERLGERPREALRAMYAEGRTREEISRAEGTTETAVKALLQRARDALRECVTRRMAR